jgi:hypothetical protein
VERATGSPSFQGPFLSETRTSGNISILRWKLFLSPGDDDMFASGDIARQLDRKPSFQILLAITKTTILTRVLFGTGAGPADQDVHHAKYIINGLKGHIHVSMRIVGFLETSQGTICIPSHLSHIHVGGSVRFRGDL